MRFMQMSGRSVSHPQTFGINLFCQWMITQWLRLTSQEWSDKLYKKTQLPLQARLHQNCCTVKLNFLVGPTPYDTEDSISIE